MKMGQQKILPSRWVVPLEGDNGSQHGPYRGPSFVYIIHRFVDIPDAFTRVCQGTNVEFETRGRDYGEAIDVFERLINGCVVRLNSDLHLSAY
jgi:hypothetical protein